MQYLLLIYSVDPAIWFALPEEERAGLTAAHMAFGESIEETGELVFSQALADPEHSFTVHLDDGVPVATDGPFAEAKEQLTGFYVLDCESRERAIEIAGQAPDASFTRVEVRPIMDLTGMEM